MDGNTAGHANPFALVFSGLNSDQASGSVNGIFTTLSFGLDHLSKLNSIIARPTAPQFQALINGTFRIDYSVVTFSATNNRGGEYRILLNGTTPVPGSTIRITPQGTVLRSTTGSTVVCVDLTINDIITLEVAPLEGSVQTVLAISTLSFSLLEPI